MKKLRKVPTVMLMLLVWLVAACSSSGSSTEGRGPIGTPSFRNGEVSTYTGPGGQTIYFPKQQPTNAYMDALLHGTLVLDPNGCLRVTDEHNDAILILWHHDFTLRVAGQQVEVINGSGQVVGRTGQEIIMGGGKIPEMFLPVTPLEACPGPYWQMGGIDPLDEQALPGAFASATPVPTGTASGAGLAATPLPTISPDNQVVLTIQNDLPYRGRQGDPKPDWVGWGAQAFRYQSGDFWLLDSYAQPQRLLRFSPPYAAPQIISLENAALGATDFAIDSDDLWFLIATTSPAQVLNLTQDGRTIAAYELPEETPTGLSGPIMGMFTGLTLTPDGVPLVEITAGDESYRLYEQDGLGGSVRVLGHTYGGKLYRVELAFPSSKGVVYAGDVAVEVQGEQSLGKLKVLGAAPDGSFYVDVQEIRSAPDYFGRREVRRYSASGEQTGTAYPLVPAILAPHDLAIGSAGEMYQLVSNPDHSVQVVRLGFQPGAQPWPQPSPVPMLTPTPLTPLLPVETEVPTDAPDLEQARHTLLAFFTLLHDGRYGEAAPLFGGPIALYWDNNPSVPRGDYAQLWEAVCTANTYCLLVARIVEQKQVAQDEYEFVVEFIWRDGTLFKTGPCCGANEAQVPLVWQFTYTVRKIDGTFRVMQGPVYLG